MTRDIAAIMRRANQQMESGLRAFSIVAAPVLRSMNATLTKLDEARRKKLAKRR